MKSVMKPWVREDGTIDFDKIDYDALQPVCFKGGTPTEKQLELAKTAHKEGRYAFGRTGYMDAGSFRHTSQYGKFYLTDEELEIWCAEGNK